jgi:hypothetical protein
MYQCWNCGLWQGEDDGLVEPSRLCSVCEAATKRAVYSLEATYAEEDHDDEEDCLDA